MGIFQRISFDLKTLILSGEPLTFLVGAGISREPPSSLASALQIMEGILKFVVCTEKVREIMAFGNLRFEYIVEQFRDSIDPELKMLEYYTEGGEPNLFHSFLASMIKRNQIVMTTNYDFFIEQAVGLRTPNFKVVITPTDYKKYGNPEQNARSSVLTFYKLHGSPMNCVTGENTKGTVVTTLDAIGKHLNGSAVMLEKAKQTFLKRACHKRTLIIMGYSGGDDFDIVPMLIQMKDVSQIIWIAHENTNETTYHQLKDITEYEILTIPRKQLSREDNLLLTLGFNNKIKIIKVRTHTRTLFESLVPKVPGSQRDSRMKDPLVWITAHFPKPPESVVYYVTGKILSDFGDSKKGIEYMQKAVALFSKDREPLLLAKALSALSSMYQGSEQLKEAAAVCDKAYILFKQLNNLPGMADTLNVLGLILLESAEYERAFSCFQVSFDLYADAGDMRGQAMATTHMGIIHDLQGKHSLALNWFKEAFSLENKLGNLVGMALCWANIGKTYSHIPNLKEAIDYTKRAVDIEEKLGQVNQQIQLLNNLALYYADYIDFENALDCCQQSLHLSESMGFLGISAKALGYLAIVYRKQRQFEKAIEAFNKEITLHKQMKNELGIAGAYQGLALVFSEEDNLDKTIDYEQKAYEIFSKLQSKVKMAQILHNLGNSYRKKHQLAKALEQHQKALALFQEVKLPIKIAEEFGEIGLDHIELKNLTKALSSFQDSLKLHEVLKNKTGMADQLGNIAAVLVELGRDKEALDPILKAYKIDKEFNNLVGILKDQKLLIQIYQRIGQSQKTEEVIREFKMNLMRMMRSQIFPHGR